MGDQDALLLLSQPMTAVLPVAVAGDKRSACDPIAKDSPRRKQLRHYDLLPAQILNPMGASGVESISNEMLWSLMIKGNKAAMSFPRYASTNRSDALLLSLASQRCTHSLLAASRPTRTLRLC